MSSGANRYHARGSWDEQGRYWASQGERRRWEELTWLEKAGTITDLRRQVTYPLVVNGIKVGSYRADSVYQENGVTIVEDFKGMQTREYRLKKSLMLALYGITIREVGSP